MRQERGGVLLLAECGSDGECTDRSVIYSKDCVRYGLRDA